jgi:hypothetical protein
VLYDLSSSYFEGKCCPLAALGEQSRWQEGQAAGQLRAARPARRGSRRVATVWKGRPPLAIRSPRPRGRRPGTNACAIQELEERGLVRW